MSGNAIEKKVLYQKVPTTIVSSNVEDQKMSAGITTLRIILWLVVKTIDILYLPCYLTRIFKKSKICPPIKDEILLIPASEIAEKIRKQEVTSESVVKAYIARIQEVNPILNAVIEDRFKQAIEDAKYADRLVSFGTVSPEELKDKHPLLGVPLTVKGSIEVAGMKSTSGMVSRANVTARRDAVTVAHAREAGAIPILISNIPELCMNWECKNKLKGMTVNPYDTTRTCGGSSGGEASLLATAGSLIGIGSDVAGSLRLPAHFCGVWGHKPTPGAVSYVGHYPSCKQHEQWQASFTLGPMARYATDLKLLLEIISEPNFKDRLLLREPVNIKDLRIFYMEDIQSSLTNKVNRRCREALHKVVAHFNSVCYVNCEKVKLPLIRYAPEMASLVLLDIDDVDNPFGRRGEGSFKELFKFITGRSNSEFTVVGYGLLRRLTRCLPRSIMENCREKLDELKCEFLNLLGDDGVFILPTFTAEAHPHGEIIRKLFDTGYLSVFNALGLPVTNCPVSFTRKGLPLGVQVVGAPNCDRLTLAVAMEIEKAFGGWQPPTVVGQIKV